MRTAAIIALSGLALTASAVAQPNVFGTIQDGPAIFSISPPSGPGDNTSTTGNGPSTYFTVNGAGGPNYLPNAWWWGRVEGVDNREFAIYRDAADTNVAFPAPNQMRIRYTYAGQFRVTMTWTVSGFANGDGELTQTVNILSLSSTEQTINLYNYNNIDVFGTGGNDSATQTGPNTVQFSDGQFPVVTQSYQGANALRVDTRPNVLGLLTNGVVDNVTGGVVNAGPADLEIASQFIFTLAPGGTQSISVVTSIIPTPGAVALLGLGGLVAGRRRRA